MTDPLLEADPRHHAPWHRGVQIRGGRIVAGAVILAKGGQMGRVGVGENSRNDGWEIREGAAAGCLGNDTVVPRLQDLEGEL